MTKFELTGVTIEMTPRIGEAPLWVAIGTTRNIWVSHAQMQLGVTTIISTGVIPHNMGWIVEPMNAHTLATLAGPTIIKDTWRSPHSGFNALAEWQSYVSWLYERLPTTASLLAVDDYLNRLSVDTIAQLYKALGSSDTSVIADVEQPPTIQCVDCTGTGKYQGLWSPEEICSKCSGTGVVPQ